jgi:hypothetical protein
VVRTHFLTRIQIVDSYSNSSNCVQERAYRVTRPRSGRRRRRRCQRASELTVQCWEPPPTGKLQTQSAVDALAGEARPEPPRLRAAGQDRRAVRCFLRQPVVSVGDGRPRAAGAAVDRACTVDGLLDALG